jgi:hypothetical protein
MTPDQISTGGAPKRAMAPSQRTRQWEAVVKAPQDGPVYTHHFEGVNPSTVLRQIADALDLSDADGVQISMAPVTTQSLDRDPRYLHLAGRERQEAIRESNQRAGGDPYGG